VIFCFTVLKPAVDLVCDPHYLNSKLYGWLSYKERLVAKAKRKYLYAATYEDFMEMIEQCGDIEQLKHIRLILQVQAWTDCCWWCSRGVCPIDVNITFPSIFTVLNCSFYNCKSFCKIWHTDHFTIDTLG